MNSAQNQSNHLPDPAHIAEEFERACSGDLPKAIQMLRAANCNPLVVGMKNTSGKGMSTRGRPDAMLLTNLPKIKDDEDFCIAFRSLARTFAKASGSRKLQLCQQLVNRVHVRCRLVDEHLQFVREAVRQEDPVNSRPSSNLFNHYVAARLVDWSSQETLQQACEFLGELKKAGLQVFHQVRIELSSTPHTLMIDAFAALYGPEFILNTRDCNDNGLLHRACKLRITPFVIERLIDMGCDPMHKNDADQTPLQMSVSQDNEVAVSALLRTRKHEENDLVNAMGFTSNAQIRALLDADRARIHIELVLASNPCKVDHTNPRALA